MGLLGASLPGDLWLCLDQVYGESTLARALYRRPRLLVLDEATSHLDVERERLVNAAVQRLRITRIVIAHRPETVAAAGKVIRLGVKRD